MEGMDGLNAFLEDITLMSDLDNAEIGSGGVALMTVHMAKGLEFDNVIVVGLEQGMFPHSRVLESPIELEEERRCMYVAMTRAKKHLYLSYANSRFTFGSFRSNPPSAFLREIPAELMTTKNFGSDLFGGFSSSGGSSYSFSSSFASSPARKALPVETRPTVEGLIRVGDLLSHAHFGNGRVVALDGDIATIAFADGKGIKRLNVTIAPLTRIAE